ncbi:MAG: 30S ribosomal protein S3 [Candidatus Buchananbacteria bacterium]|jgi:small subunit ribosomal protein S3
MGQKVNAKAFRLKINKTWDAKWFTELDFAEYLMQDMKIKKYIRTKFRNLGISSVEIERSAGSVIVNLYAARPGLIIGRGGSGAEDLKKELKDKFLKDAFSRKRAIKNININIIEVANPNVDSAVLIQSMATDIEKRIPFRRVVKQTMGRAEKAGAKGVKVIISGRLDGAEIARRELFLYGKVPLHTLRADIDYARGVAQTIYGTIGIKVWIYKGDIFEDKRKENIKD